MCYPLQFPGPTQARWVPIRGLNRWQRKPSSFSRYLLLSRRFALSLVASVAPSGRCTSFTRHTSSKNKNKNKKKQQQRQPHQQQKQATATTTATATATATTTNTQQGTYRRGEGEEYLLCDPGCNNLWQTSITKVCLLYTSPSPRD